MLKRNPVWHQRRRRRFQRVRPIQPIPATPPPHAALAPPPAAAAVRDLDYPPGRIRPLAPTAEWEAIGVRILHPSILPTC